MPPLPERRAASLVVGPVASQTLSLTCRFPVVVARVSGQPVSVVVLPIRRSAIRIDHFPLPDNAAADLLEPRPNALPAQAEVGLVPSEAQLLMPEDEHFLPSLGNVVADCQRRRILLGPECRQSGGQYCDCQYVAGSAQCHHVSISVRRMHGECEFASEFPAIEPLARATEPCDVLL